MSAEGFVQHGYRGALLCEKELPPYYYGKIGKLRIFDIGHETLFGTWYPDNARCAAPRAWFPEAKRAFERMHAEGKLYPPTLDGSPPSSLVVERVTLRPRGSSLGHRDALQATRDGFDSHDLHHSNAAPQGKVAPDSDFRTHVAPQPTETSGTSRGIESSGQAENPAVAAPSRPKLKPRNQ